MNTLRKFFGSTLSLYVLVSLYGVAGIMHFLLPSDYYLIFMPTFLPIREILNYAAGVLEVLLALGLLFKKTRDLASFLIIILLCIFLVLIHGVHLIDPPLPEVPYVVWIIRFLVQLFLVTWIVEFRRINSTVV